MNRRLVTAGAAVLSALALAPVSSTATARPVLRLVDTEPLAVQGVRFDPAATVRVRVLTLTRTWTRRVEVGARGTFMARFPVSAAKCGTWLAVQATASDGTKAGLRLPQFECPARR
jgi:hypothetical protein